ncbi:MAG: molybdopterin dinucleotide binding domain-containing protein, partial [Gemmatimonadales bacterium]
LERLTGVNLTDLAADRAGDRITLADARVQPRTVITSPEWSGIEAHGRRYAPFTINVERHKPWHTLSGRQHLYLDHAWMLELGEGLPVYRPPLDYSRFFGDQGAGDGRPELVLRYLTPHSKWSIHSEYQDNLHMLTLFRGGSMLWLSVPDAAELEIADHDWVELLNRNGVVACRAAVSHRIPRGTCMMYHAKDRHLQTPRTELTNARGGTDNSLTRITIKPTHLIGGYAQLSFGFNYYGPTGSQRDEVAVVRRRLAEVEF